ncbi:MAG: OsmC family protein [Pirellulaceae bacterium]
MGSVLDPRGIKTADNLTATVEGIVEEVDNVLTITRIHLIFRLTIARGQQALMERALKSFAKKCPAYQSVKDCIRCTWEADISEI